MLIIEGQIPSDSGISPAGIQGALLKISGAMQIPIVFTKSTRETAAAIERVALQVWGFTTTNIRSSSDPATFSFYQRYILAGIPGIGIKRAEALIQRFGSLKNVFAAPCEQLTQVPGIGLIHARRIAELSSYVPAAVSNPHLSRL